MRNNRIIIVLMCLMSLACQTFAQDNKKVVVKFKDNTSQMFNYSDVSRMVIREYGQHTYVDLGLPSGTKWATCNVGATAPEGYGDYFAWGETYTKDTYTSVNSIWYRDLTLSSCTVNHGSSIGKDLISSYDAATDNWGNDWKMPIKDQVYELCDDKYTTKTWTTVNGVECCKFTSKINGKYIYIPAAGYKSGASTYSTGSDMTLWTANPDYYNEYMAHGFTIMYGKTSMTPGGALDRSYGFPVRAVCSDVVMARSIISNVKSISLESGKTGTITPTIYPEDATNKNITWKSNNESIATVSSTGVITAKAAGSTFITAYATGGYDVSKIFTVNVAAPVASLNPAFTVPSGVTLNTTNGTSYPWVNTSGTLTPGNSGVNSSDSYFTATITSTSATTLSFNWYVSSESGYDFLYYSVDGGTETKISGSTSSASKSISLTAGTHTVKFGYRKDGSASSGSDKGYVSNLVITKNGSSTPTTTTHEYVDLGLPSGTKWATCNIGASKPEEYGNYYAWGETTTKTSYSTSNSKWYNVSYSSLQSQGVIDSNGNLVASYDVASVLWGSNWKMPTVAQISELQNSSYTTWTQTTLNGVKGYKVTSRTNGKYIFLPFAGWYAGSSIRDGGSFSTCWCSQAYRNSSTDSEMMAFEDEGYYYSGNTPRYSGYSVRPVYK